MEFFWVLLGAIITIIVSHYYYKRAGDELRLEANKLREETLEARRLTNMVLRGLHNSGIIEVIWQDGNPVGIIVKFKGKAEMKTSTSDAELSIKRANQTENRN